MYLNFYDLKERPFTLSPDPKYLYFSPSHKEALSQMIYAVTQDSGFMMLTGEVGTGKTILINSLSKHLPEKYLSARIYFTIFSPKELIQSICKEFGIAFTGRSISELVMKLQEFLKWRYHLGRKSVLILDEAQNLSWQSLEMIRLLSNVEAMHEKFFQILLVGQPEFEARLKMANLRQLRERIGLRFRLGRLSPDETRSYIRHRLSVARSKYAGNLFSKGAVDKIFEFSEGIPRRINILCDNALLMGYATNSRKIGEEIIEEVGSGNEKKGTIAEKHAVATSPPSIEKAFENRDVKTFKIEEAEAQNKATTSSLDYSKLKGMLEQLLIDNRLLLLKRPRISTVFFATILGFIVLTLIFFCAVLITLKLGFILFG